MAEETTNTNTLATPPTSEPSFINTTKGQVLVYGSLAIVVFLLGMAIEKNIKTHPMGHQAKHAANLIAGAAGAKVALVIGGVLFGTIITKAMQKKSTKLNIQTT